MWVIPSTTLLILLYACQPAICCIFPRPEPTPSTPSPTSSTPSPTSSTPSPCKCGIANSNRIVGGEDALESEFPWQVGLVTSTGTQTFCGGTLISPRDVLTAAHCVIGKSASDIRVKNGEEFLAVCQVLPHPKYNSTTVDSDYAIIHLCEAQSFSSTLQPACLPTNSTDSVYENKEAIATGWGRLSTFGSAADTLQKVTLTTLSNNACCRDPFRWSCRQLTSRMICAAGDEKGICFGDSGGPLVVKESGGYYTVVGVASFVAKDGCGESSLPSVFARVTGQLFWINNNMVEGKCEGTQN